MKPRLRKVAGFWHCLTPEAQGIGVTPSLAWREYMDQWIEAMNAEHERSEREYRQHEAEFQQQMAELRIRAMMGAYGFVMNETGKVVEDLWRPAPKTISKEQEAHRKNLARLEAIKAEFESTKTIYEATPRWRFLARKRLAEVMTHLCNEACK